jgi:phage terminase small subunit
MARLTNRQRIFIEEYLTCWNASEAARRAGFTGDANTVGPRLLANVGIKAAVEARIQEKAMTADEVLIRLAEMARVNMGDFLTFEEREIRQDIPADDEEAEDAEDLDDIEAQPEPEKRLVNAGINWEEVRRRGNLIKKITPGRYGYTVELVDNQAALQLIGKHLQLFVDRTEITGKDGGPVELVHIYIPDNGRGKTDGD